MMKWLTLVLAALLLAGPARAAAPAQCLTAQHLLEYIFSLPNTARAIDAKKLDVLVVGAGSSRLPGPNGPQFAYPARLQRALTELLPGVAVKVATDVQRHRTAAAMAKSMNVALAKSKPALVIWQTGTVDAMQGVDPERFNDTLEQGIAAARAAGADVILVNAQYSPRTGSMIALGSYIEDMRWVALQYDVPLFNRFEIMRLWDENGTFALAGSANKLDTARRVHACIGWLLADLITEAAKSSAPQTEGGR